MGIPWASTGIPWALMSARLHSEMLLAPKIRSSEGGIVLPQMLSFSSNFVGPRQRGGDYSIFPHLVIFSGALMIIAVTRNCQFLVLAVFALLIIQYQVLSSRLWEKNINDVLIQLNTEYFSTMEAQWYLVITSTDMTKGKIRDLATRLAFR